MLNLRNIFVLICILTSHALIAETITSGHYSVTLNQTPDWVKPEAIQAIHSDKPSTRSVDYLLTDRQIKITEQSAVEYNHYADRPNTLSALENSSRIEIRFQPSYEALELHSVRILRGDKIIPKLNREAVSIFRKETETSYGLFDGSVTAQILVDGSKVGDIIEYSYSIKGLNPVFGNRYAASLSFGWSVPVDQVSIRLLVPDSRPVNLITRNIEDSEYRFAKSSANGYTDYQWSRSGQDFLRYDGDTPAWYRPYPRVEISEYSSWRQVSEWAIPLYTAQKYNSAELTELTERLSKLPSAAEKVSGALAFVQGEIRYWGIEMGINSHKPRSPDTVMERRYGDCKDKTLMLVSILNQLGIKAYPALVSSRHRKAVENHLPGPNAFDHVITLVDVDGKLVWLDPTKNLQSGRLSTLGYTSYGQALVIGHNQLALTKMPTAKSNKAGIQTEETISIRNYNEPVDYQISTLYRGLEADDIRNRLKKYGVEQLNLDYFNYMKKLYPSIELVRPMVVDDSPVANEITLLERYSYADMISKDEDGDFVYDVYAYSLRPYLNAPDTVARTMPMRSGGPVLLRHRTIIRFPEHLSFTLEDPTANVSTPFFRYTREENSYTDRLVVDHRLSIMQDHIPANAVKSALKEYSEIKDLLSSSYYIESDESEQAETQPEEIVEEKSLIAIFAEKLREQSLKAQQQ